MYLLVDNNSIALKELSDILKYVGLKDVHPTESANDAWAMMKVREFKCVISAWEMEEMTGLALLKIARNDDRFFDLPFFLTDSAFTKVKVIQAGKSGVSGLLVSPYNVDNVKGKMASLSVLTKAEPIEEEKALEKGMKLIEGRNYGKALKVFSKLTEQGENAEYYYNIGYIKTAQEEYGEAIEAFKKATQLDRLFAKAFEAMGRAYKEIGDPEGAEKYLQKAADIYMTKENDQDAEEILKEIMQINPETANVYNSLGVLYRKKGDLKSSLGHYTKALNVHPNEPYIYYNIGRLHLEMKDPLEAKDFFAKAVKIDPDFVEAQEVLNAIELGSM